MTRAPLLLVSHGSRHPDAAAVADRLAAACAAQLPGTAVMACALDHTPPDPVRALLTLAEAPAVSAGAVPVVVAPLLFTAAYHVGVDIPAAVERARQHVPRLRVLVADPLADDRLLDALDRLTPAPPHGDGYDARVLASAGSTDAGARRAIEELARSWGARHGTPAVTAYASAAEPNPAVAVAEMRAAGARRVLVGSLFVAAGYFADTTAAQARDAGAVAVTEPLRDAREVVAVLLDRYGRYAGRG